MAYKYTLNGEQHTAGEWADILCISSATFYKHAQGTDELQRYVASRIGIYDGYLFSEPYATRPMAEHYDMSVLRDLSAELWHLRNQEEIHMNQLTRPMAHVRFTPEEKELAKMAMDAVHRYENMVDEKRRDYNRAVERWE